MNHVYLVLMKSDHSIASIWTTQELAIAAVAYYNERWGTNKVFVQEWQVNVTRVQY